MPGDAPEMEPEFVRLVGACERESANPTRVGWQANNQWIDAARAALYAWHRAEVERAVGAAVEAQTRRLLDDAGWSGHLRGEPEPFGGPGDA